MKLAIIGSRKLAVKNLEKYLPNGVSEIVSGGARGVDTVAKEYAKNKKSPCANFCLTMRDTEKRRRLFVISR